ncbi:ABC transporter ATP-binding protein [Streptomyces shenzhenensis]|uniref:ABC transporter ATP-binding protein n=1 Tax=Streptomyces shenzhenensis TaxID=943815 RepID=UPI00368A34E8
MTDAPGLSLRGITKTLGGRKIVDNLDLDVNAGELICLLGPSGCGKSTTLRMIGGFMNPDAGTIAVRDRDVTALSPERRPTGMVFQNYALWPHMTVFQNVAFGLQVRGLSKAEIREKVETAVELVGLNHHLRSRPGQISGGEQQRAALARSIVLEPDVLLLDEPLSNLDAKLRVRVRDEIREIQRRSGITTVFVTHDQEEALAIADRIAVMNAGRIEQYDAPDPVYRQPATRFVANFVGTMNFLDAHVTSAGCTLRDGTVIQVPGVRQGTRVLAIRPEDVRLVEHGQGVPARVVRDVPLGHYRDVTISVGGQELHAFTPSTARPAGEVAVVFERAVDFAPDGETAHV